MSMIELDHDSFTTFINGSQPALVDFWAPWCMPCKIFFPVLHNLMDELDGRLVFGRLNVDDNVSLAQKYEITSIPTVILFKNGEPVEQVIGVTPREEVLTALSKHI